MAYCMYLRKSRCDGNVEDTLKRHNEILNKFCLENDIDISKIYKEVVSGETISARPEMKKMLAEISDGAYEGVVCMEIERLARGNSIDQGIIQQTFKYSGTKIITPNKIYNPKNDFDETFMELGLFLSRQEYKTIKRRLEEGRNASAVEGKYLGTKDVYGYRRVKLKNEKGFSLEINEAEARNVRKMFELYSDGMSLKKIAEYLNLAKIRTKNGKSWSMQSVGYIIRNPLYCGKIRWKYYRSIKKIKNSELVCSRKFSDDYELYDGLHKPLISEEMFFAVQKKPFSVRTDNGGLKNPFLGIMFCKNCGGKMIRKNIGKNKSVYLCEKRNCNVSTACFLVEKCFFEKYSRQFPNEKFPEDISEINRRLRDTVERIEYRKERGNSKAEFELDVCFK